MQDCQEEIAIFLFINFKTGAFCEKSVNINMVYAGEIKKIAEFLKKDLTNGLRGCILATSNGKGVVSDER